MRFSIWLTTFLINTLMLGLFVSSIAEPFGLTFGVQALGTMLVYLPVYLFYLRCPVCHTLTTGWRVAGEGFFALYLFAPLMNPGRCSRCSLSFHRNTFRDDFAADRRRWRLDNP
jgi:hypothetical protein